MNFLNDRIGFLSLDSQAVMCTTDGGLDWTWLLIPTNREEVSMATGNIFFPDSNTVLIWGTRTLNVNPSIQDYGLYRAKLNIPPSSIVEKQVPVNQNALSILTYPNPTQSLVHVIVSAPEQSIMRFDILDMLGRTLFSRMETNTDFTLDLQSLPDGVYTLRCTVGVESATTTFTVDR
jgi:Secretion system C-terminal sorting domain